MSLRWIKRVLAILAGVIGMSVAIAVTPKSGDFYAHNPGIILDKDFAANGNSFQAHIKLAKSVPFRAVGAIRGGATRSGVWIGGPYVLTTAHSAVIEDSKSSQVTYDPRKYTFTIVIDGREYSYRGVEWIVPHEYVQAARGNTDRWKLGPADMCILRLDRSVSIPGVDPAAVSKQVPAVGDNLTFVGYGRRGLFSTGPNQRRFGAGWNQSPPEPLGFTGRVWRFTSHGWQYTHIVTEDSEGSLEGGASGGDSGGGVFVKRGESYELAGIICFSSQPNDGELPQN